ncbi:hypothetical protein [Oceanobacillus arenosus]|uniref:hypothetical protein n=1 Tax=Oceanobacillus arenosus TaxID=1229153 RepID=UPI001FEBD9B3|nr:hypothetical protein [Oceanobacillus arenosus]
MNGKDILNHFGFTTDVEPISIYPFSSVYKVKDGDHYFIVKRTQNQVRKVMEYITMLKENGAEVVTPVPLKTANPQMIGNETYVTYPFIEGTTYTGENKEIVEAGRLLGKIHSLSPSQNSYNLAVYDVFDFTVEEVVESVQKIKKIWQAFMLISTYCN